MFKYVKFEKVETRHSVLEFRGDSEDTKVNHFSDNDELNISVVSIESKNEDSIDALIESQPSDIECEVITQGEFKTLVKESAQLKRIRVVAKEKIAQKYDIADEIALSKLAEDDEKRIAYEEFVTKCLEFSRGLKSEIGY